MIHNKAMKEEAMKRLNILVKQGLDEKAAYLYKTKNKVTVSETVFNSMHDTCFPEDDFALKEMIEKVVAEYHIEVYYASLRLVPIPGLSALILLGVSTHNNDWKQDKRLMAENTVWAYCCNVDGGYTDVQMVRYHIVNGSLYPIN